MTQASPSTFIDLLYSDFIARDLSYLAAGVLIAWTWALLLNRSDFLSARTTSGLIGRLVVFHFLGFHSPRTRRWRDQPLPEAETGPT